MKLFLDLRTAVERRIYEEFVNSRNEAALDIGYVSASLPATTVSVYTFRLLGSILMILKGGNAYSRFISDVLFIPITKQSIYPFFNRISSAPFFELWSIE